MTREGLKANYKKQAWELIAQLTKMKAELEKPLYGLFVTVELLKTMDSREARIEDESDMELQDILGKMNYLVENMFEPNEDYALLLEDIEDIEEGE